MPLILTTEPNFSHALRIGCKPLHGMLWGVFFWAVGSCLAQEPTSIHDTPLTTAKAVAQYPHAERNLQPAVDLTAVVTFVDSTTVYLQDETGSTFLHAPNRKQNVLPGQLIHTKGIRHPGLIIGGIAPKSIEIVSGAPLPAPHRITEAELGSGRWHYHLVETDGIVRNFQSTGENSGIFKLRGSDGTMEIRMDVVPESPRDLIDAHVHVTGLASGVINAQRQLVSPYIRLQDPSSLKILKAAPQDPFQIAITPITELKGNSPHRVKIRGIALSAPTYNHVYLRDRTSSIVIRANKPPAIKPGDTVEAIGFVTAGPTSARLGDATCRIISSGPEPLPVTPKPDELHHKHDGNLVQFNFEILQRIDSAANTQLFCRHGSIAINIISRRPLPQAFATGASVSATGLLRITKYKNHGHKTVASAADLQLRKDEDIRLLSHPPRLNQEHLTFILGIVMALAIFAAAWAALLKRQVARQTKIIQQKIESEAITEERHRIARDFHDTLEQDLAGIALRLDAAAERVTDAKAQTLMAQLRKLLLRMQQETREFIWNLRESPATLDSLPNTLRSLSQKFQSTSEIPIQFEDQSNELTLQAHVQHQLYFIVREAVHNAIKYAKNATYIKITMTNTDDDLTITVRDDGCGFIPSNVPAGHYGLQGMSERARKINATLIIDSTSDSGTAIILKRSSAINASSSSASED